MQSIMILPHLKLLFFFFYHLHVSGAGIIQIQLCKAQAALQLPALVFAVKLLSFSERHLPFCKELEYFNSIQFQRWL